MARTKRLSDEELLRVAREIFVAEGFTVSTKTIARQAGVSEGVLFQRFAKKEDLFFAAMIPPPADLTAVMTSQAHADGLAAFSAVVLAMLEYFRATQPVFSALMAHPSFRFEEFAEKHPDTPIVTLRRDIGHFMVREQMEGRMGPRHPGAAALVAWSIAHTIAYFEHMGAHGGRFDSGIVRATIECAWKGLAPQSPLGVPIMEEKRSSMSKEVELTLRITLVAPPAGVRFCLQRGSSELVDGAMSTGEDLTFEFPVRVLEQAGGGVRLLGHFVQGPPAARFVYVCSGARAGQHGSVWTRRVKIPLKGIEWRMVEQVSKAGSGSVIAATIAGTSKDGGPACATVPLLGSGWSVVRRAS